MKLKTNLWQNGQILDQTRLFQGKNKKFTRLNAAFYSKPRGVLNKVLYRKAPPQGPAPHFFIQHFCQKRYPFRIPSIDKCYPLSVIPSLELCISFNCCKRKNHCTKPENFLELFTLIKLPSVAFLGHFTDQVTGFPTISYTSTGKIPSLSYIRSLKKVPLSGGASPYRPLQRVSPPRDPKRTTE